MNKNNLIVMEEVSLEDQFFQENQTRAGLLCGFGCENKGFFCL